jgi:hypothetical protein
MKPACDMCHKVKRTVERVPSRRMLLFGPIRTAVGHLVTYEYRCQACETKVAKWIDRTIAAM